MRKQLARRFPILVIFWGASGGPEGLYLGLRDQRSCPRCTTWGSEGFLIVPVGPLWGHLLQEVASSLGLPLSYQMKNTIHNVNSASERSRQGQSALEIIFRVRHHGQVCRKAPQRKRTGTSVWEPHGTTQEPRALFSFFIGIPYISCITDRVEPHWNHTGTTSCLLAWP